MIPGAAKAPLLSSASGGAWGAQMLSDPDDRDDSTWKERFATVRKELECVRRSILHEQERSALLRRELFLASLQLLGDHERSHVRPFGLRCNPRGPQEAFPEQNWHVTQAPGAEEKT